MGIILFIQAMFVFSIICILISSVLILKNKELCRNNLQRIVSGIICCISSGVLLLMKESVVFYYESMDINLTKYTGFSINEFTLCFIGLIMIMAFINALSSKRY
ncbi:hypothetical protein P9Z80_24130 [Bacillus cereus]|nr:hypothetical protein [Bacillus cereus]MEC3260700.1 hypothetical protein [Bacillus cereus]